MAVLQEAAPQPKTPVSADEVGSLTFVTSDGERITFSGLEVPAGEAAAVAGEEALEKIWNRPAEDQAWRDM